MGKTTDPGYTEHLKRNKENNKKSDVSIRDLRQHQNQYSSDTLALEGGTSFLRLGNYIGEGCKWRRGVGSTS